MTDDLIRRQDAINAMGDYLEQLNVSRRYAKSIINKCPSAQPEPRWKMDEFINKSKVISLLAMRADYAANDDIHFELVTLINKVRDMPTVDVVTIIRCKDCKHWDGYYCHNKRWGDGYGNYTPPIKTEDGFCDWAERKEE